MSDFDKNRLAFTVALIALSISLYPILSEIKEVLPMHFEPYFKIRWIFLVVNASLGIYVYLYAVSLTGINKSLKRTKIIADVVYRITIFIPMLYFYYYIYCLLVYYEEVNKGNLIYIGLSVSPLTNDMFFNSLLILALCIIPLVFIVIVLDVYEFLKGWFRKLGSIGKNIDKKGN